MTVTKFKEALIGQKIIGVGIRGSKKPRGFVITHLILENGEAYLFEGADKNTDAMIVEGKWQSVGHLDWNGYAKDVDSDLMDCEVWAK